MDSNKDKQTPINASSVLDNWFKKNGLFSSHIKLTELDDSSRQELYHDTLDLPDKGHRLAKTSSNPNIYILSFLTGCLRSCLFCAISKMSYPFSRINLKELEQDIAKAGRIDKLILTAPEPFIHPDFISMLKLLKPNCNMISCFGCAEYLSDEELCKEAYELGIKEVQIMVLSTDEKIHDKIVQREGHYRLTIKAIHNMKKVGMKVYAYSILMSLNINGIPKDFEFMTSQLEIPYVIVPLRKSEMTDNLFNLLLPDPTDIKKLSDRIDCMVGFPKCMANGPTINLEEKAADPLKLSLFFSLKDYSKGECNRICKGIENCPGMIKGYKLQ